MDKDVSYYYQNKKEDYDEEIRGACDARKTSMRDTSPDYEYEGFLGMDDIDRIRRKKLKHYMHE